MQTFKQQFYVHERIRVTSTEDSFFPSSWSQMCDMGHSNNTRNTVLPPTTVTGPSRNLII